MYGALVTQLHGRTDTRDAVPTSTYWEPRGRPVHRHNRRCVQTVAGIKVLALLRR